MATVLTLRARTATDRPADPMVLNPLAVSGYTPITWEALQATGLDGPIIGPAAEEGGADPAEVPTDSALAVGQTQVYFGSFDETAIEEIVSSGRFSETSATGVFAHDEVDVVVRWASDAIVVGSAAEAVETVFDTGRGQVDRRHATDADFEWLLRTGGHGDLSVARHATGETVDLEGAGELFADYSMFEGSKGYAQSATVEDGAAASATTGVVYDSEDRVARDRLESTLGVAATDRTIQQDGRRLTIEASYGGGDRVDEDSPTAGVTTPGLGAVAGLAGLAGGAYLRARRGDGAR